MAWNVYGGTQSPMAAASPAEDLAILDALTKRMMEKDANAEREYWKRVMDRANWCFLCDPKMAQEAIAAKEAGGDAAPRSPAPLSWTIDGKTMIGAFTSEPAAIETLRQIHGVQPGQTETNVPAAAVMAMPVADAVAWLSRMPADKVQHVVFNRRGTISSPTAPIANLAPMYEWCMDRLTDDLWDPFVRAVQTTNQPASWARLRRRLALIDTWFLPLDPGGANVPLVVADGERKFLALAATNNLAVRAFTAIAGKDLQPRVGSAPRAEIVKLIEKVTTEEAAPKEIAINIGGAPIIIEAKALGEILTKSA